MNTRNGSLTQSRIVYEVDDPKAFNPSPMRLESMVLRHVAPDPGPESAQLRDSQLCGCSPDFIAGYLGKPDIHDDLDPATPQQRADYVRGQHAAAKEAEQHKGHHRPVCAI